MNQGEHNGFSECGWFVCLSVGIGTLANPVNPAILSKNLYSYDVLSEAVVAARDIDLDGQIDFAGPDIVSSNATEYVNLASAWWRESRQYAFPDAGSSAPLLVSTSRQRLSGLGGTESTVIGASALVSESVTIDALGNASTRKSYLNRDAHATASVSTTPDSTLPAYSISVGGLSLTNCTSSGIVSSREYDALGRVVASTDGRGNTTTLSYDAQGRVSWSEDALGNRTTLAYDALGRQVAVTNALGQATYTAYDAENRVISTWGATYPVAYAYDDYGRMTAMNTFRDEAMQNGDTTTWLYHEPTGLLTNKVYADGKGPSYTYTPDGKLASRTWARGSVASYAYDASGQLTGIDYSDTTPDVSFTYDRLGRQLSAIADGVSTNLYAYSRYGHLTNEIVQGLCAASLSRTTDSLGRSAGLSVAGGGDPGSPYAVSYGYDAYGRFDLVSSAGNTYSYSYLPGSSLVSGMTASTGHAWTRSYEPNRNLISAVQNTFGPAIISRFDYKNDAIGRRVSRADSGEAFQNSAFDKYSYNTRSEVIGAQRYHGTNPADTSRPFGGRGFGYAYDPIGNRLSASETVGGETLTKSYTANALNQYTSIANPDAVGLRGSATNTATVTVNGEAALSDSIASDTVPWHFALQADNADGGDYTFANIMAVVNPPGTNTPDIVSTASGHVYAPPQEEVVTYDDDGNLVSDGRWQYTWNGENRLIKAEELVSPTNRQPYVVEYAYDHQGRMAWKKVASPNVPPFKNIIYLWDDFNIIVETTVADSATNTTYNVWGLDLNGTMQGAGGVGGLLAVVKDSATYVPAWDANGNIMEYVTSDGTIAAHREYDPFGGTVVATGDVDVFTHWFSTKPWCVVTGLSEYQYRKFSPVLGRWVNRDAIGERGGVNLFHWTQNTGANRFDYLGLDDIRIEDGSVVHMPERWWGGNLRNEATVLGVVDDSGIVHFYEEYDLPPMPLDELKSYGSHHNIEDLLKELREDVADKKDNVWDGGRSVSDYWDLRVTCEACRDGAGAAEARCRYLIAQRVSHFMGVYFGTATGESVVAALAPYIATQLGWSPPGWIAMGIYVGVGIKTANDLATLWEISEVSEEAAKTYCDCDSVYQAPVRK